MTALTKSRPCSHVLSCLAMFYSKAFARSVFDVCIINNCCLFLLSLERVKDATLTKSKPCSHVKLFSQVV